MPRKKTVPVPKRRNAAPPAGSAVESGGGGAPDLSMIVESLRPLAVPISELIFDPANARKHPEGSISAIAASLRVYGQVKPVVVRQGNGVVIAGNGTLSAALSLNWTHLAAVKVAWDGATSAGFSISDNRVAELSEWDAQALDMLLREVSTANDARLDEMMADLAREMKIVPPEEGATEGAPGEDKPPPEEFPAYGEDIETQYQCPKCGYRWSGSSGGAPADETGEMHGQEGQAGQS